MRRMPRTFMPVVFFLMLLSLSQAPTAVASGEAGKPVAVLGYPPSRKVIVQRIVLPENLRYDSLDEWLPPREWGKYSVVYLAESHNTVKGFKPGALCEPVALKAAEDYVRAGGVLILTGAWPRFLVNAHDLKPIAGLLGFARYGLARKTADTDHIRPVNNLPAVTGALEQRAYDWLGYDLRIDNLTTARPLAEQRDENGTIICPFATVNVVGKGKVFWFAAPLMRLLARDGADGEADAAGNYLMSNRAVDSQAYRRMIGAAFLTASPAKGSQSFEKWDPTPLGAPGTATKATVNLAPIPPPAPPVTGAPVPLAEDGKAVSVIVLPSQPTRDETHVAEIIGSHVKAMSGADIPVLNWSTLDGATASATGVKAEGAYGGKSFLLLGAHDSLATFGVDMDKLGPEGIALKTVGATFVLAGKEPNGLRHAAYTFLEKLGCRYLWPGELGKVIPKSPTVVVPPMDISEAPQLWSRAIRAGLPTRSSRYASAFHTLGIDPMEYAARFAEAAKCNQPDDGWFAWHRMGAHRTVARGHSFGDYWTKYGKKHPEWFALQPNGVRDQSLSASRPRLCHSNQELIAQVVKDKLAQLQAHPELTSLPIGLNDGGSTTFCMGENCRHMDPTNGSPIQLLDCFKVPRRYFGYVSLSDRVLAFTNQVIEGVVKERPDVDFGYYAYSVYNKPPLEVKPHPNLVIFYVGESLDEWDGWAQFGNKMFYRPNILLRNRRALAPQNFARELFDKMRHMYRTGLIGTDFDSCQHHWAVMGLVYYVLAKANWNPTALDYDALVDDYCRAGFGPAAAPMRAYLGILAQISEECATLVAGQTGVNRQARDILDVYTDAHIQKLQACLDEARHLATRAEDKKIPCRIEFVAMGLELVTMQLKYRANPDSDAMKKEFIELLQRFYHENILAVGTPIVATYARF